MKGGMRIYTKNFRCRFRDKTKMERMGTFKEIPEKSGFTIWKRTGRSKWNKLDRMEAR
jgi:hypothetical protein